ncbi:MAG TPA: bifunctional phosphopantothenoylcysteine decarboxylase/phosphopantothenate--cysteine ligase CoaBC [Bacteroidales bacterium]|nr:bifunctional phosphopantothenoylcysteine decarboxylase/phosphopantothenate--cysteine ligase CoaBC [Bacteroidales bacterium]HQI69961.1 bifunctional phosphopantothenoylcysteine decarboxylase/phosphopantothenate--cysteine ligase CoaBC [Bacteroidales bacterium]
MLKGKKILIGITGSIAAYKIPLLIRLLKKEGADVQVLVTPTAKDFVTPLTLATLSGHPVLCEGFDPDDGAWHSHIEWGSWADIFLIAPVSANTLAKMANGLADNLLTTTYLAAKCPVFFAPAMDLDMYKHPATQKNINTICAFGHHLIAPREGELASGLCGAGRMEEPEKIVECLNNFLKKKDLLKNKNVLVTAGPTYESIDPVRFIGNHSSGLMGFEIAAVCAENGANVTLIAGPVALTITHPNIRRIDVVSASQMYQQCIKAFPEADIIIMAAAVADYTPAEVSRQKIKKTGKDLFLTLKSTTDILAALGKIKSKNQMLVGFALETDNESENALKKLKNKNLDLIVLNSLKDKGAGFKLSTNKVTMFNFKSEKKTFQLKSKHEVAIDIVNEISKLRKDKI